MRRIDRELTGGLGLRRRFGALLGFISNGANSFTQEPA